MSDRKRELRRELRSRRDDYAHGLDRAPLETALSRLLHANVDLRAEVASYAAIGSEVSVLPDLPVAYPRTVARGVPLTFHRCDPAELVRSSFGIPEPLHDAQRVEPAIVLVPLLGVDLAGHRIGYGAGHYDCTLQSLRSRQAVYAIGCAWDMQIVDAIPAEPWDEPLDAIVTPTRFLRLRDRLAAGAPRPR